MAGGLLNIVIYGSQDLYLTGTPEITHFKIVYRRHTNFSVESIRINFEDTIGFGIKSHVVLPRIGDLIYKTYLEVNIPQVKIKRSIDSQLITDATTDYINSLDDLHTIGDYMNINIGAYRKANDIFTAENDITVNDMILVIQNEFNNVSIGSFTTNTLTNFKKLIAGGIFDIGQLDLYNLSERVSDTSITKESFMIMILSCVNKSYEVQEYYENLAYGLLGKLNDLKNDNYKFAWVKRLGHSIIDYVTVYIGGQQIDKHYGDWINIWYELTKNSYQEENYMKMIGDMDVLTNFDRKTKPTYTVQVPLNFWFCRFNGLGLPLLAMEYHDVSIEVKFRTADECAYLENTQDGEVSVSDIFENNDINIGSSLLVDYVYLDGPERRKFAQSAHEYLIDQVKFLSQDNVMHEEVPIRLDFNHPCKELIWVAQKQSFMENLDGHTETKLWNYGISDNGTINPVKFAKLQFNGHERVTKSKGSYFNLLRPYTMHRNIPPDGINIYSFALAPEENQPSGSCNFSRISNALLTLYLEPSAFFKLDSSSNVMKDPINIRVYALTQNVLRIIGGMGALAFA